MDSTSFLSPLPGGQGWPESSHPPVAWLVLQATSPHSSVGSKSHLIHIKKHLYHSHHLRIPRVLGAPGQKQDENQTCISYCKSQYHSPIALYGPVRAVASIPEGHLEINPR